MPAYNQYLFFALMALATSFIVTFVAIPSIIGIAKKKHLFDEPDERKSHSSNIPTLGGIAIFGGFIIALSIWSNMRELNLIQYVLAASCLIFLVGAKDDIVDLDAYKKFIIQIIATLILVFFAELRFTSFHDLFPGFDVPYWLSVIITTFTILVIINSFNLIDGINGLSGSQALIISATFGIWFWIAGDYQMVILIACLIGALLAFLKYNFSPAKIFMGDTGSLLIGLICAVLAIRFAEMNIAGNQGFQVNAAPAVAIGFLAFPLFDLLRAFSIRIAKGRSPFSPDRNHLHHMLLDVGLSHMQATATLAGIQIFYICFVYFLQHVGLNSWAIIGIILTLSITIATALRFKVKSKQQAIANPKPTHQKKERSYDHSSTAI